MAWFSAPGTNFCAFTKELLYMEYNLIADFLAKFAACSDPIKAVIIVNTSIISVSFLYIVKQTITESLKLFNKSIQ